MDRFKYIQVQDQKGNYGDNIPFEIDSQNVLMEDSKTLQKDYDDLVLSVSNKVEKEEGKGLSSYNFTEEEHIKLAGIASEANKILIDEDLKQAGQAADAKVVGELIKDLRSQIGAPPIWVDNPSKMINQDKIYVYIGEDSEEWDFGCWYYYGKDENDNKKWLKGGAYSQAAVLNDLKDEVNQAKQDLENEVNQAEQNLENYTNQTLEESATTINNYVNEFNTTAENLTERVEQAEAIVQTINDLPELRQRVNQHDEDIITRGQASNGIINLYNKDGVRKITIEGVGDGTGGGGSGVDDPEVSETWAQQSRTWSNVSKTWAVGNEDGEGSPTNNSKYWSNLARSYAKIRTNSEPQIRQGEEQDNAQYYSNQAAAFAEEAKTALITQKQLAKAWAIGPDSTSEEEQPSATNNAKYYATEYVDKRVKSWMEGGQGVRDDEDSNNFKRWNDLARRWAIGDIADPGDGPDGNTYLSAKQYAERAYQYIHENAKTGEIKRTSNENITAEDSFVTIESNLVTINNSLANDKVDQLESKFKLDVNAEGEDKTLYDLLVSLNWWDTIKINE